MAVAVGLAVPGAAPGERSCAVRPRAAALEQ